MSRYILLTGGGGGGAVESVFGRTGAVAAEEGDYAAFYQPIGVPRFCYGGGGTSAGSITVPGSGDWTLARSSAGVYVVTFDTPFTTQPAVMLTLAATKGSVYDAAYSTGGFTVNITVASVLADDEFHFVAVGT